MVISLVDHSVERLGYRAREILICTVVLVLAVIRGGTNYSFGTLTVAIREEFNQSLAEAGFLLMAAALLATSFVSNPNLIFVTYSLPFGIGAGLSFIGSSLIIGEYFDVKHKYHVLTTSLLLCGYTVGSLLFNPVAAALLEISNWRNTLRVDAALFASAGIPLSALLVSKRTLEGGTIEYKDKQFTCRKEMCSNLNQNLNQKPETLMWIVGNFVNSLCYMMPFLNLASYMQNKGVVGPNSSVAIILLSLFEAVGYILASLVGDKIKGRLIYVNVIASFGLTIICAAWPFVDGSYFSILVVSMAYGTCLGLSIVYSYAGSAEITQLPLDVAWGYTSMSMGFAMLLGPFLSGLVYDLENSFDNVFYVTSAAYGISLVIFIAIAIIREKWRIYKNDYQELNDKDSALVPLASDLTNGQS